MKLKRFFPSSMQATVVGIVSSHMVFSPTLAYAQPEGGRVVAGEATIDSSVAGLTQIEQLTNRAIINWNDFSIAAGTEVRVLQPDSAAALLNRVTGDHRSYLDGALTANGRVFLVNPNGVIVGKNGVVRSAGFVASTLDVADTAFMGGGDLLFSGESDKSVVNLGRITATEGDVVLMAHSVRNAGGIEAKSGVAALAAGQEVLLSEEGDQRVLVRAGQAGASVENTGAIEAAQAELKAAGGSIYEMAINQEGSVRAMGVEHKNGRILLTAGGGAVEVSGTMEASDADGSGGEILVGGDYKGENAAVANAAQVTVSEDAVIEASATAENAAGGRVIVWSDGDTDFEGTIRARGGSVSGDGGFVEVSGAAHLRFNPLVPVDVSAAGGETGILLLDPDDLTIVENFGQAAPVEIDASGNPVVVTPEAGSAEYVETPFPQGGSQIERATLESQLATANVILRADGTIRLRLDPLASSPTGAVSWTSGNTLTLEAGQDIDLLDHVDAGTGGLNLLSGGNVLTQGEVMAGMLGVGALAGGEMGDAIFEGALRVSDLTLDLGGGNFTGEVRATNAGNEIERVVFENSGGSTGSRGSVEVYDGTGDLAVAGVLDAASGVELLTEGSLTIESGAQIGLHGGGDEIVLAAKGGSFTNLAGASALGVDEGLGQRFLIYADTKSATTLDGLSGQEVFSTSFADAPPSSLPADDISRVFYVTNSGLVLLIRADDLDRIYGNANPGFTFSVSGLEAGDSFADVTSGSADFSTLADEFSNVGSYDITASLGNLTSGKYDLTFADGTLNVNKASLLASASNESIIYGDALPNHSISYSGFRNGDTAAVVDTAEVNFAGSRVNAGVYDAVVSGSAMNYEIVDDGVTGELNIGKRALTAVVDDAVRFYGEANPVFGASYAGFVSGDIASDLDSVSLVTGAGQGSDTGTYQITGSGTDNNYSITYAPGTLTVNKAMLSVDIADASRTYGEANPIFSAASITGFVNGDAEADLDSLGFDSLADVNSDAGIYAITGTGSDQNYEYFFTSGQLAVAKAELTWGATGLSKVYGDALTEGAVSPVLSGFKNGDTQTSLDDFSVASAGFMASADAGSYDVIASLSDTNYVLGNSALADLLIVNPASLSVSALAASKIYGENEATIDSLAVTGAKNGDVFTEADFDFSSAGLGAEAGAGSYVINAILNNANYVLSGSGAGDLTVQKRALAAVLGDREKSYGDLLPTVGLALSGYVNGDERADLDNLVIDDAGATFQLTDAGTYTMSATLSDDNYFFAEPVNATLTVNPKAVEVSPNFISGIYGDEQVDPGIFVNGKVMPFHLQNVTYDYEYVVSSRSLPKYYTEGVILKNVELNDANYTVGTLTPGFYDLLKRPVTVRIEETEVAVDTYLGVETVFGAEIEGGSLASGDRVASRLERIEGTLVYRSDGGERYDLIPMIFNPDGTVLANPELYYDFEKIGGLLTVRERMAFTSGLDISPTVTETKHYLDEDNTLADEENTLPPSDEELKINGTTKHLPLTYDLNRDLAAMDIDGFGSLIGSVFIDKILPLFDGKINVLKESELGDFFIRWSDGEVSRDEMIRMYEKYPAVAALMVDLMPQYITNLKKVPYDEMNPAQLQLTERLNVRIANQRRALVSSLAVAIQNDGQRREASARNNQFRSLFGGELHNDTIAEAIYQQSMANQETFERHAERWAAGGGIAVGTSLAAGAIAAGHAGITGTSVGLIGTISSHAGTGASVLAAAGGSALYAAAPAAILATAVLITVMAAINYSESDERASNANALLKELSNPNMDFRSAPSEVSSLATSQLLFGGIAATQ